MEAHPTLSVPKVTRAFQDPRDIRKGRALISSECYLKNEVFISERDAKPSQLTAQGILTTPQHRPYLSMA